MQKLAIESINKEIKLQNNQKSITKRFLYLASLFAFLSFVPINIMEGSDGVYALTMISFWLFISSLVIAWMFRSRSKKLQSLITGESLLASWRLTPKQKANYVNYLFEYERGKNSVIFTIMVIMIVGIFGIFILIIDEGKLAMLGVAIGLLGFLSLFAFGMPYYYRHTNNQGDGEILIGAKYAYINGYFHNWDFPLSGLSQIKIIQEPFYGIDLVYYYTDRTLRNTREIMIPANEDIQLEKIIEKMREANPKKRKKK